MKRQLLTTSIVTVQPSQAYNTWAMQLTLPKAKNPALSIQQTRQKAIQIVCLPSPCESWSSTERYMQWPSACVSQTKAMLRDGAPVR